MARHDRRFVLYLGSRCGRRACFRPGLCRGRKREHYRAKEGSEYFHLTVSLTTAPLMMVPMQWVVYSNGSPSYIAMSASFPTAIEPIRLSSPRMRAASMVIEASASRRDSPYAVATPA